MAQYITCPGDKKRRLMKEREAQLRRLLEQKADTAKCREAAEALRETALAYYHAIKKPEGRKPRAWRERTVESILEEYGRHHDGP